MTRRCRKAAFACVILAGSLLLAGCGQPRLRMTPEEFGPINLAPEPAVYTLNNLPRDLTPTESSGSAVATLVRQPNATVRAIRTTADLPQHSHADRSELVFVLEGKGIATVGDTRYTVAPRTVLVIPAGYTYGFIVTEEPCTVISTYISNNAAPEKTSEE